MGTGLLFGQFEYKEIHGRFESRYVDLIETTAPDVVKIHAQR